MDVKVALVFPADPFLEDGGIRPPIVNGDYRNGCRLKEPLFRLVQIPANPEYSSLNVAMAVQLLAYELLLAARGEAGGPKPEHDPATGAQMESFFGHLAQAVDDIGFTEGRHAEKLLRRLRRLFLRVRPDVDELTILRGILSAAQGRKSMRRE